MDIAKAALAVGSLFAVSAAAVPDAGVAPSTVPFTIISSGGSPRVIVTARFNDHPMPMMVHSDAAFFAQLRHAQAAAFGVRLIPGTHRDYGIDRVRHVSGLGLDKGIVESLAVGRSVDHNAPVSVFEVPQKHLAMLGLGWITANRVVVDFGRKQVSVAPSAAQAEARKETLRRAGYVALPMRYDEKLMSYTVQATIHGVTRRMTVATSTAFVIDSAFAAAASVKHDGSGNNSGNGPTGTHVPNSDLNEPVRVTIDGWTSPAIAKGQVMDTYGYDAAKRPADASAVSGGSLGGAFLQQTAAVVDFGTRTLYVKK